MSLSACVQQHDSPTGVLPDMIGHFCFNEYVLEYKPVWGLAVVG